MKAFYQAIEYIKSTLESAPLLNTITHGTDIIDNVKKNIFTPILIATQNYFMLK